MVYTVVHAQLHFNLILQNKEKTLFTEKGPIEIAEDSLYKMLILIFTMQYKRQRYIKN